MAAALRCAVYTRKSSEEGLEQDYNSLHAQRDACEAYVRSQAGEGWNLITTAYDDGGFSGGSLERPGLKRLLTDIAAGRIDVVVVYKVDRLTRSLADFAKIVETFDARGVSFVSVTQSFNTTTSMGRLTLNMLLSFAQFEREVTGERIRDKIAASKAKGMWMGGMLPLGYDPNGRTLAINEAEAELVRRIFERYLAVRSVKALVAELAADGIRSKVWTTRSGKVMGGVVMGRGAMLHILQSRLYLGEIVHKGVVHAGLHPALVSSETFAAVQAKLARNAVIKRERGGGAMSGVLKGILFDADGGAMSPSFGYGRGGRLYRYYIAMGLQVGRQQVRDDDIIRRVSAPAVEQFLVDELQRLRSGNAIGLGSLGEVLHRVEIRAQTVHLVVDRRALFGDEHPEVALVDLRRRLGEHEQAVVEPEDRIRIVLARRLQLRGGRTTISGGANPPRAKINVGIINALRRAHQDLNSLNASPLLPPEQLKEAAAPATQHDRQLSRLAFLAPDLQRDILEGRQPHGLDLRSMLKSEMPLAWADQKGWLQSIARA
jgi:DNA invertase Pin-like site-specific DNA recombinase